MPTMSKSEEQALEISALRCIYCKEGEMIVSEEADLTKITINLDLMPALDNKDSLSGSKSYGASVLFSVPQEYPELLPPMVGIKCSRLDKSVLDIIAESLLQKAQELLGETMLLNLACFAKELVENELMLLAQSQRLEVTSKNNTLTISYLSAESAHVKNKSKHEIVTSYLAETSPKTSSGEKSSSDCSINTDKIVTALLHLDHMRSKTSYTKLIKKWAHELNLVGRLIFCQRLILILLQGSQRDIKEYIVRNRTTNVDVDSRGKSCKERMLSVLCEVVTEPEYKMQDFSIAEFGSKELTAFFKEQQLQKIYDDYVLHLLLGQLGGSKTSNDR